MIILLNVMSWCNILIMIELLFNEDSGSQNIKFRTKLQVALYIYEIKGFGRSVYKTLNNGHTVVYEDITRVVLESFDIYCD